MSAPFAILRLAKLKTLGHVAGSAAHSYRTRETPNANREAQASNEHSHDSPKELVDALKARLPEKRRKDAVLGLEYFVGASPEWFSPGQDGSEYFYQAIRWLQRIHGKENVVGWSIHRDEKTPHLVVYVAPIDPDSGRLNAKRWTGGPAVLAKLQTDFALQVGASQGLQRGIEGSRAKHQDVQDWYAQIAKPVQQVQITPQAVEPRVVKKGWITSEKESPEMVAKRLTTAMQKAYAPAVKRGLTAESEARRAREMTETAQKFEKRLQILQKRFDEMVRVFQPLMQLATLSRSDFVRVLQQSAARVREIEQINNAQETAKTTNLERSSDRGNER